MHCQVECGYFDGECVLIIAMCLFQRVPVAKTDFVVDRIRSRLDDVDTANLQSKEQTYYYDLLKLCTSNYILKHYDTGV